MFMIHSDRWHSCNSKVASSSSLHNRQRAGTRFLTVEGESEGIILTTFWNWSDILFICIYSFIAVWIFNALLHCWSRDARWHQCAFGRTLEIHIFPKYNDILLKRCIWNTREFEIWSSQEQWVLRLWFSEISHWIYQTNPREFLDMLSNHYPLDEECGVNCGVKVEIQYHVWAFGEHE